MEVSPHVYQLPIVIPELRRPETHLQLFDSLDNLNKVINGVFGSITNRIQEERRRLDVLRGRIDVADAKVKKIAGSTKATTVFSPAKYPAPEHLPAYQSLLALTYSSGSSQHTPKHTKYHLNPVEHGYAISTSLTAQQTLSENQHSFRTSLEVPQLSKQNSVLNTLGVGPVPEKITSVSSLLLFNTEFNPYRGSFQSYDPLEGQSKPKQAIDVKKKDEIGAQPATILEGDTLPMASFVKIGYVPELGDVPVFELPDQLPNLPGVADLSGIDTSQWSNAIAPSLGIPDLPDVLPPTTSSSNSSAPPLPDIGNAPPPPSTANAPPPPPPPPSGAGGPPPPPPPPPPSAPSAPPPPVSKPTQTESSGDARQDLLAAIRAGKSLKTVDGEADSEADAPSRRKKRGKAPPPPPKGNTMMNMFGDLLTALDRRRKGMMAQNEIKRDEPAQPASSSAPSAPTSNDTKLPELPSLDDDSEQPRLKIILPTEEDDDDFDSEDDPAWQED